MEVGLKAAGYSVTVNAEKPRKGAFVVTVEGGGEVGVGVAVELLDLARPFKRLRELDLDAAVASIVN